MSESDIACMGELGACAAGAGAYAFPFAHVMPQPSYQQALEALIEGVAGRALIPAYNTRTGAMPEALSLMARSDFEIVGEVWREIELHVLVPRAWVEAQHRGFDDLPLPEKARARAGLLGLISDIYADQAAFNQYGGFLKRALPRAQHRVTGCTGEAARLVYQSYRAAEKPEKYPPYAALASREAAAMYGLVALTENLAAENGAPKRKEINDNWTLFYLVEQRAHAKRSQSDARWKLFTSLYGEARVRRYLRDADLQLLFEKDEQLRKFLPNPATRAPEDVHAAERDYDLAKVLFDALSVDKGARSRLASRARVIGMYPDQVKRVEAAEKAIEAALRQCARWNGGGFAGASLRGAKEIKSVLVLRAKAEDRDGQRLLAALYAGRPSDVRVRLLATLPAPTDGKAGPGFVVETDGYLAGLDTARGFFLGGTPAERLLARLAGKGEVHILGSLPRAAPPVLVAEASDEKDAKVRWPFRTAAIVPFAMLAAGALYFLAH